MAAAALPRRQAGMVLLLCLMLLCSLTLVGLSATADSLLQDQLASNEQDLERARQTALAALSWAEDWLLNLDGAAPPVCTAPCDGLMLHAASGLPAHPEREDAQWWAANGHEAGIDPLTGGSLLSLSPANAQPAYWLLQSAHSESLANGTTMTWYRILVRATGHRATSVSVVESLLLRNWPQAGGATTEGENTGAGETAPGSCSSMSSAPGCGRLAWRRLR
jgi:type IV pilus assembly protein PilX